MEFKIISAILNTNDASYKTELDTKKHIFNKFYCFFRTIFEQLILNKPR